METDPRFCVVYSWCGGAACYQCQQQWHSRYLTFRGVSGELRGFSGELWVLRSQINLQLFKH